MKDELSKLKEKQYSSLSCADKAINDFLDQNPQYKETTLFGINKLDHWCYEIEIYDDTTAAKSELKMREILSTWQIFLNKIR